MDCQDHETDFYFQSTTNKDFGNRFNRRGDWFNEGQATRMTIIFIVSSSLG